MNFWIKIILAFQNFFTYSETHPVLQPPVMVPPAPIPVLPPPQQTLQWDTAANARHSVRVLCDDMGMNIEQKNTMCATIGGESGWLSYYPADYHIAALRNKPVIRENIVNGKVWSTDWGICQWNDYYHGAEISGGPRGDALNNPEKAVRLMGRYWMLGETYRLMWVAYKNGTYRAYL